MFLFSRRHKEQRSIYIPLHLSLLSTTIHNIAYIVIVILELRQRGIPGRSISTLLRIFFPLDLFFYFSFPLLFFAFFNLIRDRFNTVNATVNDSMGRINRVLLVESLGYLIVFFVSATTNFALQIVVNFTGLSDTIGNALLSKLSFLFYALLALSAVVIGALSIYVYKAVMKVSAADKVCFKQSCIQCVSIDS